MRDWCFLATGTAVLQLRPRRICEHGQPQSQDNTVAAGRPHMLRTSAPLCLTPRAGAECAAAAGCRAGQAAAQRARGLLCQPHAHGGSSYDLLPQGRHSGGQQKRHGPLNARECDRVCFGAAGGTHCARHQPNPKSRQESRQQDSAAAVKGY